MVDAGRRIGGIAGILVAEADRSDVFGERGLVVAEADGPGGFRGEAQGRSI